jgi:hypothetical protein
MMISALPQVQFGKIYGSRKEERKGDAIAGAASIAGAATVAGGYQAFMAQEVDGKGEAAAVLGLYLTTLLFYAGGLFTSGVKLLKDSLHKKRPTPLINPALDLKKVGSAEVGVGAAANLLTLGPSPLLLLPASAGASLMGTGSAHIYKGMTHPKAFNEDNGQTSAEEIKTQVAAEAEQKPVS